MIYVVKCYYCEQEFQVKRGETGADIMCPKCGGKNSIRDVIERIEDEPVKVDSDLQSIKKFDMAMHPVCDSAEWESEEKKRWRKVDSIISCVTIIILIIMHLYYTK